MRRRLLTAVLPGLVVAACFLIAFTVRRPTSGVEVTTVRCCPERPVDAHVTVGRPGRRAIEAGTHTGGDGRARLLLEPGRYELRARAPGLRMRPRVVRVADDAFGDVKLRLRRRRE